MSERARSENRFTRRSTPRSQCSPEQGAIAGDTLTDYTSASSWSAPVCRTEVELADTCRGTLHGYKALAAVAFHTVNATRRDQALRGALGDLP